MDKEQSMNAQQSPEGQPARSCTTLDHIYPRPRFGQSCYCGARVWGGRPKATATPAAPGRTDEQKASEGQRPSHRGSEPLGAAQQNGTEEKVQKGMDSASAVVVDSLQSQDAAQPRGATKPAISQENTTMAVLTFKGLNVKKTQAIYTGAAASVRFMLGTFKDKTPPQTLELNGEGVLAAEAKVPAAKMTPEERKAARAAKPKPTLAEKVAAAQKRAADLAAKLEAESKAAEQPAL